jgi:Zn-finger nucleic acid-binding protein
MREGYYDKVLGELKRRIEEHQKHIEHLTRFESLYERALSIMEADKCPICGSTIQRMKIEEKLKMVKYELSDLKNELAKLIKRRNDIYAELNEYERKKKELEKLLEEYRRIEREHPEILGRMRGSANNIILGIATILMIINIFLKIKK